MTNSGKYKTQGHEIVPGKQATLASQIKQSTDDLKNWFAELKIRLGTEVFPVLEVRKFSKKKAKEMRYKALVVIEHEGRRVNVPDAFLVQVA